MQWISTKLWGFLHWTGYIGTSKLSKLLSWGWIGIFSSGSFLLPNQNNFLCDRSTITMDTLTSHARPSTDAVITVRCIKSFEYRTCKSLVLQHLNLETTTVGELKELVRESRLAYVYKIGVITTQMFNTEIKTTPGWKPYHNVEFGNY